MMTIAEGLETPAHAPRLAEMGCRLGQGFLYSPPVPAPVVRELLKRCGPAAPASADDRRLVANAA